MVARWAVLARGGAQGGLVALRFDEGATSFEVGAELSLPHASFVMPSAEAGRFWVLHGTAAGGFVSVVAFDGVAFELISTVPCGAEPCHAALVTPDSLAVACYTAGAVDVFSVHPGARLEPEASVPLIGNGPDADRQEGAHPHFVMTGVPGSGAIVVDLGSDVLWELVRQDEGWGVVPALHVEPGSGPRHAVLVDEHLVVTDELSGAVTAHRLPLAAPGRGVSITRGQADPRCYPGDLCRVPGGRTVAASARGRSAVALVTVDDTGEPHLTGDVVIPGAWIQQLAPTDGGVLALDRDGDRILLIDVAERSWTQVGGSLSSPMWLTFDQPSA